MTFEGFASALIACDFSVESVAAAVRARRLLRPGAKIHLQHVLDPEERGGAKLDEVLICLHSLAEALARKSDVRVEVDVARGKPADEIVTAVERTGAALVSLGVSRKRRSQAWHGSIAAEVVRRSRVPALVAHEPAEEPEAPIESVIVAVDLETPSQDVIRLGARLATKLRSRLAAVHVVDPRRHPLPVPDPLAASGIDHETSHAIEAAPDLVSAALAEAGVPDADAIVVVGNPAEDVARLAMPHPPARLRCARPGTGRSPLLRQRGDLSPATCPVSRRGVPGVHAMSSGETGTARGLSRAEAEERLRHYGPNAVPEETHHPVLDLLKRLWAPIPWLLEASFVLELVLGHPTQATIIAALLAINAVLGAAHERRARAAIAMLRARLAVRSRVLRDGEWSVVAAERVVPGDVVYLRLGDMVPADVRLVEGHLLVDASALTGESVPVERGPGEAVDSGSWIRRGEAKGEVTATGTRTAFGKTAELVRHAQSKSHFEALVLRLVRALVIFDGVLVGGVLVYGVLMHLPLREVLPFALMLLVAAVPVALPATMTLATALGSLELVRAGVLVTRLSAIDDAAAMDVLCADKTGTITKNELALACTVAFPPHSGDEVLLAGALASEPAAQDPIDAAVIAAARERGLIAELPERLRFVPFEPATKRSEAFVRIGRELRVVAKGAPASVRALDPHAPPIDEAVEKLALSGNRVIAVAQGPEGALELTGLVALADPPREGTDEVIERLRSLGIRIVMVTGDGLATARSIATRVGIGGDAIGRESLDGVAPSDRVGVIAGVLPEDKFKLVKLLQEEGHVVGMTGDGVNDAPALGQAEVGVAVSSATDVARGAASVVLTTPGLSGIAPAVEVSRRIYQRMLTYTLNKLVKTFHVSLLLGLGLLVTGSFVASPLQILLLLLANDLVTMSIATDRTAPSKRPDRWNVRALVTSGLVLGAGWLLVSSAIVGLGKGVWKLTVPEIQTAVFLALVMSSQATVYLVRERARAWSSRPGRWLLLGSAAALVGAVTLTVGGVLMAPIPSLVALEIAGIVAVGAIVLDFAKVAAFRRVGLARD